MAIYNAPCLSKRHSLSKWADNKLQNWKFKHKISFQMSFEAVISIYGALPDSHHWNWIVPKQTQKSFNLSPLSEQCGQLHVDTNLVLASFRQTSRNMTGFALYLFSDWLGGPSHLSLVSMSYREAFLELASWKTLREFWLVLGYFNWHLASGPLLG